MKMTFKDVFGGLVVLGVCIIAMGADSIVDMIFRALGI